MPEGVIISSISSLYAVETVNRLVRCRARGKLRLGNMTPLVGDKVNLTIDGDYGAIDDILPRRNSFIRPAVANVDQIIILCSDSNPITEPFLVDRIAAIAELKSCEPVIVINKSDLVRSDRLYDIYKNSGLLTIRTSTVTNEGISELQVALRGKISVLTGNSGVGKSSVLNALNSEFCVKTGEVSQKLGRGRHTTRHVELYKLGNDTMLIDTPGFSSFDAEECVLLKKERLQDGFREFAQYTDRCRFSDCAHVKDAGCAVIAAVSEGKIARTRHESYCRLMEQALQINKWELKE